MQLIKLMVRPLLAAALAIFASVVWAAPADEEYAAAAREYAARQWQQAAEDFTRFAADNHAHPRAGLARFYAGEALVQLGKYEEASRRLSDFLEQDPQHRLAKTALFRVGECLLLAGKNAQAEERLEEFRKAHPADELNAFALVYLGDIALEANRTAAALARYEQALREYPTGPLAVAGRFGLARCRQLRGQDIEALADYEIVAMTPDDPLADDARLQAALIQYERQEFAAAEDSLAAFRTTFEKSELRPQAMYWLGLTQLAASRAAEAVRTLELAAGEAVEKDQPAVHVAWGDALRLAGDQTGADEKYKLVLSRWAECDQADDALHGRLLVAELAHDEPRATALAAEFLRRYPENPLALGVRLAQVRGQLARQEFAQAEPHLAELVTQAASSPGLAKDLAPPEQIRYWLALAQVGQHKFEAALKTVETIETTDSSLATATLEIRTTALLGLKRYDQAAPLLRTQLTGAADRVAATKLRSQLVVALAGLEKLDEAAQELAQLDAAGQADPAVARIALQVAERAYRSGNLPLARRLFEPLSAQGVPGEIRSQALSGLAWTQFRAEGKQASAATFERLLRDYPESPLAAEAALLRGKSLEDLGQNDAALATYQIVIDRYAAAPQLPDALLAAARLHDKLEQDREAAALFERLVTEFPKHKEIDAALYERGWALIDSNKPDQADATFQRLFEEYPQSKFWADATYRLAERATRLKDYAKSAALLDALLQADGDPALRERALYLRGQVAASAGAWDEVEKFMQQFVDSYLASPVRLSAEYWLAEADFRRNKFAAAREKLQTLEAKSAGREESWLAMAPLRRAQCLAQEKRWSEALAIATTIGERYPQFKQQYEAEYLIGRCLGSLGRLDDARLAYQRVLDTPSANKTETAAMAQWMIGETWFHQKRYSEAVTAYQRAVSQHTFPRWQAASLLQAGKCHWLLGQLDRAAEDFRQVAENYADTPYAAEAKQRLVSLQDPATTRRVAPALRSE